MGSVIGPPAVFGHVTKRIVNPINAVAIRGLAHVGKEIGVVVPTFTDGNASTAVVGIAFFVFIRAPLSHPFPDVVRTGAAFAVCSSVGMAALFLQATAASGFSANS